MNNSILSKIETAISTNSLIYWLSKIPFIKKYISVRLYSESHIKSWFRTFAIICKALLFILLNILYLVAVYILSSIAAEYFDINGANAFTILWSLLLLLGNVYPLVFEDTPSRWLLINIFRMNPNQVFLMSYTKRIINRLIYGIFATVAMFIAKGSYYHCLWAFILPSCIIAISNYISYKWTVHKKRLVKAIEWFSLTLVYCMVPLSMFLLNTHLNVLLPIYMLIVLFSAIFAHNKLQKVNQFDAIVILMKSNMKLSSDIEQSAMELSKKELRIDESFDVNRSHDFLDKFTGYRLLNVTFFDRHRRMWYKPLLNSVRAVVGLGVVQIVVFIGLKLFMPEEFINVQNEYNDFLIVFQNILIMGLYGINASRRITKACFLNCDYSLLHYAFYKRKETIWKQYIVRLTMLIGINLIPVLVFALIMALTSLLGFIDFFTPTMFTVISNLLMFSAFFSTIYVFLYYILQPFDKDMNMDSPLYGFITLAVYYLGLYSHHVLNLPYSNLIILGGVILFLIISTVTVRLIGHKTFKLRTN